VKVLAMVLFAIRDDGFGFTELVEHDDELAALDLLHFSREKVSNPAGEFVADFGALAFAYTLDDSLLRRLHGRAPELGEINGNLHLIADLEVGVLEACFLERYLAGGVRHFFHDGLEQNDPDCALVLVDIDFSLDGGSVLLGEGGVDAIFEEPVQFGAIDLLGVCQLADRRQDLY
jgi:hypothetical protein